MILTTLSFGDNVENHYQATFAILTYLNDDSIEKVCIVTDRPKYYRFFKSKIEIIEIDENIISEWAGCANFFWRIKMKAIESVAIKYPLHNILYVDSDTFNIKNLSEIKQGLDRGYVYMHENEGKLHLLKSKTIRSMWNVLSKAVFFGIEINETTEMWNAGVIALNKKNASTLIQNAITICDEICNTSCPRRLVEQLAFSLALNATNKLNAANINIGHYWGNKPEWNANITDLMLEVILCDLNIEQAIILSSKIIEKNIPIIIKERDIKQKLIKLIQKSIKPKETRYA